jgi:hypothetical protein
LANNKLSLKVDMPLCLKSENAFISVARLLVNNFAEHDISSLKENLCNSSIEKVDSERHPSKEITINWDSWIYDIFFLKKNSSVEKLDSSDKVSTGSGLFSFFYFMMGIIDIFGQWGLRIIVLGIIFVFNFFAFTCCLSCIFKR